MGAVKGFAMNEFHLFEIVTTVRRLTIPDLLALRIVLDDANDIANLSLDIDDLKYYPNRISDSYPEEWRSYVVNRFLEKPSDSIVGLIKRGRNAIFYSDMLDLVETALAVSTNKNVIPMNRKCLGHLLSD